MCDKNITGKDTEDIAVKMKTVDFLTATQENEGVGPFCSNTVLTELVLRHNDEYYAVTGKETELHNLCTALKYLGKTENDCGLLATDFILEVHEKLMNGTEFGGVFSTNIRCTPVGNGRVHYYPTFCSIQTAENAVDYLLDLYNRDICGIGKDPFVTVGKFVFTLLSLHPFADGNGRLARLLAYYALSGKRESVPVNFTTEDVVADRLAMSSLIKDRDGDHLVNSYDRGECQLVNSLYCHSPTNIIDKLRKGNFCWLCKN